MTTSNEKVFGSYARYYNLLYKDKDYQGEAKYVVKLLNDHGVTGGTLLELGCGTGIHAGLFSKLGFDVHGIDHSSEMLKIAQAQSGKIKFSQGDVRELKLNTRFDAVVSLFHVMSYQTTTSDLKKAFQTAAAHLNPRGVFVFDCWYGPAVLKQKPTIRVKQLENQEISVMRIAVPDFKEAQHVIDVNYRVFVCDKSNGSVDELRETHSMRYLFREEIEALLRENGLKLVACEEWMTGKSPNEDTWGVCFVARHSN